MPTYSRLIREERCTIDAINRNGTQQEEIAEVRAIAVPPRSELRHLLRDKPA